MVEKKVVHEDKAGTPLGLVGFVVVEVEGWVSGDLSVEGLSDHVEHGLGADDLVHLVVGQIDLFLRGIVVLDEEVGGGARSVEGGGCPVLKSSDCAQSHELISIECVLKVLVKALQNPRVDLILVIEHVVQGIVGVEPVQVVGVGNHVVGLDDGLPGKHVLGLVGDLVPGVEGAQVW